MTSKQSSGPFQSRSLLNVLLDEPALVSVEAKLNTNSGSEPGAPFFDKRRLMRRASVRVWAWYIDEGWGRLAPVNTRWVLGSRLETVSKES